MELATLDTALTRDVEAQAVADTVEAVLFLWKRKSENSIFSAFTQVYLTWGVIGEKVLSIFQCRLNGEVAP